MQKTLVKILVFSEDASLRGRVITLLHEAFPQLFLRTCVSPQATQNALIQTAFDAVITDCTLPIPEVYEPWTSRPLILGLVASTAALPPYADVVIASDELDEIPGHIRTHARNSTPNLNRSPGYQAFFDAALDAVFIETIDGEILDCNTMASQMYGYSRAELCALCIEDLVTGDIAAQMPDIKEQHGNDTGISIQAKGKRKDGTSFDTEVSTRVVTINGKKRVVAYVRDITSEKQARTALLESERLYRTLFEQANDAIFIESMEDRILDANPRACDLMGYSRDELLRMTVSDLQAPEIRGRAGGVIRKELSEHQGQPFESVNVHRDGTRIPVEVSNSVLQSRNQQLILSIVRDIRTRKAAEEQRWEQQARLQRQRDLLIQLSTDAKLVNRPLKQALKIVAQRANEALKTSRTSIWQYDKQATTIRCLAAVDGPHDQQTPVDFTDIADEIMTQYLTALQNQRALAVSNVLEDERTAGLAPYWRSCGITSTLDAPVRLGGKTIGVICYEHVGAPREWEEEDITFAGQVADLVAQLFMSADLRQRADEMTAIADISQQITSLDHLENVLYFIAQRATQILNVEAGGIATRDPSGEYFVATHGLEQKIEQWFKNPAPPEDLRSLFRFIRQHDAVVQIPDPQLAVPENAIQGMRRLNAKAMLLVPFSDDKVTVEGYLGVISHKERFFEPEDISFLTTLAQQSVNAIENAYILRAEQERRELAEALSEAAAIVNSNLDPEEVLDRILEQVARVVAGDTFNIMLLRGEQAIITRRRGYETLVDYETAPQETVLSLKEYPLLQKMIHTKEPVVVPDTSQTPEWTSHLQTEWRRSYVGVPICIGSETVGFLNVNSTHPEKFDEDDAHRLKTFADYAATAIQNARLFQRLREYANSLEQKVQARTAELQAQYARLEAVLNSTTDGIIVTTTGGNILQENLIVEAWRQEAFSAEDSKRFQEAVATLARSAISRPDVVLEMSNLDLQLQAAPITGTNTGAADVVIAAHDVSQLKTLERMKSQFISDVSHELRTPVTTIKLYLQLLRQSPQDKHETYLKALETEAERQAKLIQEILEFSSLKTGQLEIQRHPVQLNQLIDAVLMGQYPIAQQNEITLKHSSRQNLPEAWGNPDKIEQVLINLTVNAIQYTPPGGEVIVSTDIQRHKDQEWIIARVQDNGFGISSEELPHIFKRFYRGEKPRRLQISGTGLGLAIVKEIMERHQGWVTVESKLDKGSTFTIGLPRADALLESA